MLISLPGTPVTLFSLVVLGFIEVEIVTTPCGYADVTMVSIVVSPLETVVDCPANMWFTYFLTGRHGFSSSHPCFIDGPLYVYNVSHSKTAGSTWASTSDTIVISSVCMDRLVWFSLMGKWPISYLSTYASFHCLQDKRYEVY